MCGVGDGVRDIGRRTPTGGGRWRAAYSALLNPPPLIAVTCGGQKGGPKIDPNWISRPV